MTTSKSEVSARARAKALTAEIVADLQIITRTFWDIGARLEEVRDGQLFRALGYETFVDYIDAELGVEATQAYKMVRIVKSYVRGDAELIGLERAAALIRYARHAGVDPGLIVRENRAVGDKPVRDATVREITVAANDASAEKRKAASRSPRVREKNKETRVLADGLRGLLLKGGIRGARVTADRDDLIIRVPRRAAHKRFVER